MNRVIIKQSNLGQFCRITVNNAEIGNYSDLFTLANRPFGDVVANFLKCLDEELYEDYVVDYYAFPFQGCILQSFRNRSQFCREVHLHEMETPFSVEVIWEKISEIVAAYKLKLEALTAVNTYAESGVEIPNNSFFKKTDAESAEVGVFRSGSQIPQGVKTVVIIAPEYGYEKKQGRQYFLVPEDGMEEFWEYYRIYEKMLPHIAESLMALKYVSLKEKDKMILEVLRTGTPAFCMGAVPATMDQWDTCKANLVCYPENAFSLQSSNPEVLSLNDGTLTAQGAGTAQLMVMSAAGECVTAYSVAVIAHQYVEKIRMAAGFEFLRKNQRERIEAFPEPGNAEDAGMLSWQSSNPSVVQVDNRGNIIALQEGTAVITVSGKKVAETMIVRVRPKIQRLKIKQDRLTMFNGETLIADVEVEPKDAPADHLRWELDNRSIAACNPSRTGLRCQVVASEQYTGSGNLRCYDTESNLSAVVPVEVNMKKAKMGQGCGGCLLAVIGFFVFLAIIGALV